MKTKIKVIKKLKEKFKKRKIKKAQLKEYLRSLPSAYDGKIISWIAPEHIRHKRGKIWKVFMAGVFITAVALGIIYEAWTFSTAIVVFGIVYLIVHREHPKDVEISISHIGIKVGHRKYPFTRIRSFWLIYEPPFIKTLNIKVHDELAGHIAIQLNQQDPAQIRELLIEKIPELEGETEPLSDIFARLFKL